MAHLHYECDADGVFHGSVSDGKRIVRFKLPSRDLMRAAPLDPLNEIVTVCINYLSDPAYEDGIEIAVQSVLN